MPASRLPPLFESLPDWLADAIDPEAPWRLLGEPLESVLDKLPGERLEAGLPPDVHLAGDRIVIGAGSRVASGATLEGPIFVGRDVQIRAGAYLRGGCWIGDGCVIGAHTEVKRAILLPGAKAPHQNYVGDSILGRGVNLGAGTILSNFRHDGGIVSIPLADARLDTGRRKLGALLGDGTLTGCNAVLHPGVIVGRDTQIYPGVQLRAGVYPASTLIKLRQQIEIVERRPDTAPGAP